MTYNLLFQRIRDVAVHGQAFPMLFLTAFHRVELLRFLNPAVLKQLFISGYLFRRRLDNGFRGNFPEALAAGGFDFAGRDFYALQPGAAVKGFGFYGGYRGRDGNLGKTGAFREGGFADGL